MNSPRNTRWTAISAVVLFAMSAALPAQEGKAKKPGKAKKGETPVAAAPERKDDAVTAKDKAIAAIDEFLGKHSPAKKADNWRTNMATPPLQKFTPGFDYFWHLRTNKGEITIRLLTDVAPMHVTNAIYLTRAGFYDGLKFHRVIKGFMAQGGCPLGTGSGGPGYLLEGEFADGAKHDRPGMLSAANAGPGTDGSQFFLTFAPEPHLDGKHTVYGEVKDGMKVVEALDACGGDMETGKSTEPLQIDSAWVTVVAQPGTNSGGDAKDGKGTDGGEKGGDKGGGKDAGKGGDKPGKKDK